VNVTAETSRKLWTEAELEALPEDGFIHEVVNGRLVTSPKNNFRHGNIASRLFLALGNYAQQCRLGVVLDSSTGFWMKNRNCRAPDISFVAKGRLSGWQPSTQQFFAGAPDLAVEILSPNNTRAEINERLEDFFASGTQIAWIINPDDHAVEVCHSPSRRELIGRGGWLDGERLLPGFRYRIADLFKAWDWQD
jgi:Uma2 family endonuclease